MSKYSKLSIITISLHWLIAVMMVESTIVGIVVADMLRSPERHQLMDVHKSIGVIVLALAVVRIAWRYYEGHYQVLGKMPPLHAKGVAFTHWLLLLLTLLMPISGMMISVAGGHPINVFSLPLIAAGDKNQLLGDVGHFLHSTGMYLLILCTLLHLLGTLKYQFFDKYPVISRMFGKTVQVK